MKKEQVYDFIFAGAGAASLQLVEQLMISQRFSQVSILILEQDNEKNNDRTWCFWENREEKKWSPYIEKEWKIMRFCDAEFHLQQSISPLTYKMMRSGSFYDAMLLKMQNHPSIKLAYERIISHSEKDDWVEVYTEKNTYCGTYFFNSILDWSRVQKQHSYPVLQQHFVGWFIQTEQDCFDVQTATFMDFSVQQKGNTRFMYILPLSSTEALVEYTLFSKDRLRESEYEDEIKAYLNEKNILHYTIMEKERGNIPMTCYPFSQHNTKRILNIGSAGGWTKASTGFTFKFIQQKVKKLVPFLEHQSDMRLFEKRNRFWWYDLLFLDVLAHNNHKGSFLFSRMFQRNHPVTILRFLDEKTTLKEDIQIMRSFPLGLFVKQLLLRLVRSLH